MCIFQAHHNGIKYKCVCVYASTYMKVVSVLTGDAENGKWKRSSKCGIETIGVDLGKIENINRRITLTMM